MMKYDLLFYGQDEELFRRLSAWKKHLKYELTQVKQYDDFLEKLAEKKWSLIIIDQDHADLTEADNDLTLRQLVEKVPIFFIGSYHEAQKSAKFGFKLCTGYDLYISKPICELALFTNLSTILAMNSALNFYKNPCIEAGPFTFSLRLGCTSVDGDLMNLRKKENKLMKLLMQNRKKVVDFGLIRQEVWENEAVTDEEIAAAVKKLDKKLKKAALLPECIVTDETGCQLKV